MSRTHYFYTKRTVADLERIVKAHQDEFESLIGDMFTDEELVKYEKDIDSIAAIDVQPILSELSFEDFYPDPVQEDLQRDFFSQCRSSICLDNLPYFESNPFQVTYLIDLLWMLDEALIDRGGVSELVFKKAYLDDLKRYKKLESLIPATAPHVAASPAPVPLTPIDFLILDIYKELDRLKNVIIPDEQLADKTKKIYRVLQEASYDADTLFKKSGLIPKDFADHLEKLKFFLRKL